MNITGMKTMSFERLLYQLDDDNWHNVVYQIHDILKPELQTPKGFIRLVKKQNEQSRKDDIDRILNQFQNTGIEGLDERINTCVKEIQNINDYYKGSLQYELIQNMLHLEGINTYPNLLIAKDFLKDTAITLRGYDRLCAVLYQLCNQSLSQGNKSNAGTAGEGMVRAIFNAVGLESDIHFSEQHKSKKGSNTDFVLPRVDNFDESNVAVLVAAQLSTNDRGRLASSELKQGGVRYLVTGNGLDSSTKRLKDIGHQILQSFESDNIRIACFENEITFEKDRVEEVINGNSGDSKREYMERFNYLNTHVISFADFADKMKRFKDF